MPDPTVAPAVRPDKPPRPQPDHRDALLALRVSAGLSVGAIFLKDFLKAYPAATLADCARAARVCATFALYELPDHVPVDDVRDVLNQVRKQQLAPQEESHE